MDEPHITDESFKFKEEKAEEALNTWIPTNYPKTLEAHEPGSGYPLRYRLVYESANQAIEDLYFRCIDYLREEGGFAEYEKLTDLFAASERSAFFGVSEQRLGLQQDKVSQFLATIGKMVKELFQLVREIRILDERLTLYNASYRGDIPAEISLKGYWIDLVEGGAKTPSSVYGMARELGFITLPDLFFDAPPLQPDHVRNYVERLQFNKKLKEVLARKLVTFCVWKKHTHDELKNRRVFTVKYLSQHYDIIKMYMSWVKPYLRNVRRLQMDQKRMDSEHLIGAFEGSMVEIEVLAKRKAGEHKQAIIHLHFLFRTRPELKFQQEGYQRGPLHMGRTQMTLRGYCWDPDDLRRYRKFKEREDFALLASIDASVEAAYTALGEELERYLQQAGEDVSKDFAKQKQTPQKPHFNLLEPFLAPFKSPVPKEKKDLAMCPTCFKSVTKHDMFCKKCGFKLRKPSSEEAYKLKKEEEKGTKIVTSEIYTLYKRFKAAYGLAY